MGGRTIGSEERGDLVLRGRDTVHLRVVVHTRDELPLLAREVGARDVSNPSGRIVASRRQTRGLRVSWQAFSMANNGSGMRSVDGSASPRGFHFQMTFPWGSLQSAPSRKSYEPPGSPEHCGGWVSCRTGSAGR